MRSINWTYMEFLNEYVQNIVGFLGKIKNRCYKLDI